MPSGLAHTTQDDSFHEIQLNGKQLFFLFMAATTISVVIFLLGVMVGRGPRAARSAVAETQALSESPSADAQPTSSAIAPAPPAGTDLTMVPPPPPSDEVAEIRPGSRADEPKPAPATPDKATAGTATKVEKPVAVVPEPKAPSPAPPPAGRSVTTTPAPATRSTAPAPQVAPLSAAAASDADRWVVQVAALNAQSEANEYVRGLSGKGYSAYIMAPQAGSSSYRVRVGGFKSKGEAQTAAQKLGKEMGIKPWVTTR
jgi:cell division septation protein DedD